MGTNAMLGVSATPLTGTSNTAVGDSALDGIYATAEYNTALGYGAGYTGTALTTGSSNVYIGYNAEANAAADTNEIVIGASTTGNGSNSLDIGGVIMGVLTGSEVGINTTTYEGTGLTVSKGEGLYLMGSTSGYVGFVSAATDTANVAYTLPPAAPGTNGYVLSSSTTGTLTWIAPASTSLDDVDIELADGTAAAPSLTFYADTQTGLYQGTASTLEITTAGTERAVFDASGNFNLVGATRAYGIAGNPILYTPAADIAYSLAIGNGVLTSGSLSGNANVGVGYNSLHADTTGNGNAALGDNTLAGNTTGGANTAVGEDALFYTTGSGNTAIGYTAMQGVPATPLTGNDNNTAVGDAALINAQAAAQFNSALGYQALYNNTSGNNNTAIGYNALVFATTGTNRPSAPLPANTSPPASPTPPSAPMRCKASPPRPRPPATTRRSAAMRCKASKTERSITLPSAVMRSRA